MAKCVHCNGCYRRIWVENKAYAYCSLCKLLYSVEPGGKLVKVEDPEIIKIVYNMVGNVV